MRKMYMLNALISENEGIVADSGYFLWKNVLTIPWVVPERNILLKRNLWQVVDHFQMEGKIYHQKHGLNHSMGTHGLKIVKDAFTIHRLVIFEALITFCYHEFR